MSDDEIVINPRTGQPVTRVVRARHRKLTRDVIEKRSGNTITIKAHDFNPALHAALDYARPATDGPAEVERQAKPKPKRKTLRKAKRKTKRKRKKK